MNRPNAERLLAVECALALVVVAVARIREQKKAPTPAQMAGVVVAFLFLSALAMFGDRAAKVAGALGALLLLSELMRHGVPALSGFAGSASPTKVSLDTDTTDSQPLGQVIGFQTAGPSTPTAASPAATGDPFGGAPRMSV